MQSDKRKGRGAITNASGRYEQLQREALDDGWGETDEPVPPIKTTVLTDTSRTVISRNRSPDVPFEASINPYRGCEHGCIYCYARPTHAYLGLSPGLDFETQLFFKPDAAECLRKELAHPKYVPGPIALGANTDPYQPIERKFNVTRDLLELLLECSHPVMIVTKSALVERDLDLLQKLAERDLCTVAVSITTLDHSLARRMEPRATAPRRRLQTVQRLAAAGVPVRVLMAPIIPFLNDAEIETLLIACADAGAYSAHYVLLRLPLEIAGLFEQWLREHYPLKADRILARIRDSHGGRDYDSRFGKRMRGSGIYADLIAARFRQTCRRLGLEREVKLNCDQFQPPNLSGQLSLF